MNETSLTFICIVGGVIGFIIRSLIAKEEDKKLLDEITNSHEKVKELEKANEAIDEKIRKVKDNRYSDDADSLVDYISTIRKH